MLRTVALAAAILAVAGCSSSNVTPTPASPASTGAQAAAIGSGFTLALPWDTSASPSHEIMCAYGSEGITSTGAAGTTDGCAHHKNGPTGYTQDGDALDFDLHSGDSVRSVDAGIVRWAKAYTGSSSWSCYGNSIAIDEHQADGSVVTAFYAHLLSIKVAVGDAVTQGEEIGKAGGTGGGTNSACPSAYGPHLHLALYTNANYTDSKGAAVAAADLPASATGSREPVTSPPYGGTARLPEPWLACSRHSALTTPPSGEDASCTGLHAGDVLASSAGQAPQSPGHGPEGFSATGSMATAGALATATLLPDRRVLIAGGFDGTSAVASAELYDPKTGTFSPTGSMATPRVAPTATLLADGRVLVAGGAAVSSAELYDSKTGTFTATGSMTTVRAEQTATLLADGRVLIAGGNTGSGSWSNTAEIYDPTTGTFSRTGSMTAKRYGHTATLLSDGQVLIAGGQDTQGSAEIYSPQSGTFSPAGAMGQPRAWHTATRLSDGRVLMAGGESEQGDIATASAELYDPATGTFSPTGSMATIRLSDTATSLSDGTVLIVGGRERSSTGTGSVGLASAELYNAKTGAFITVGSMGTGRSDPASVLLPDGRVLIAGGWNADKTFFDTAELFQP